MPERAMPQRIRLKNTTGKGIDTAVLDADTGETVMGVMEVVITLTHHGLVADVYATRHWPLEKSDCAANNQPGDTRQTRQGANVWQYTYHLKSLDVESW